VNKKYISMKMEPKGRMPAAGMTNVGSAYQGAMGMGLGMLLTRQGGSNLPAVWRPKMVPVTDSGSATKSQMAAILRMTEMGRALIVS